MRTALQRLRQHYVATHQLFIPLVLFGMGQSFLGASIPLLKGALSPSDFVIGIHFFVYAGGRIISGPLGAAVRSQRAGGSRLAGVAEGWSAFGLLISMAALFSFHSIVVTVVAALFIGLFAGLLHVLIQMRINQAKSETTSARFAEAYLWVSSGVFVFPFLLALTLSASLSPFYSLTLPVCFALIIVIFHVSGKCLDGSLFHGAPEAAKRGGLTPPARQLLGLVAVNSCFEWAFGFWGSYYAQSRFSLTPSEGITIMSAYLLMTIVGRLLNIFVLRSFAPMIAYRVYAVMALALLAVIVAVPSLSLFVLLFPAVGMLSGCLYPTNLALASALLGDEFPAFIAASTVVGGISLLIFPVLLGGLAQVTNIELAFATVSIGALIVVMTLLVTLRSSVEKAVRYPP